MNKVVNNLEGVDLTDNIALMPSDNQAYSNFLLAPDGQFYVVPKEIAIKSQHIKNILELEKTNQISYPNIDGKTLGVIIVYMTHHDFDTNYNFPSPLIDPMSTYISEFDHQFINDYFNLTIHKNETTRCQFMASVANAAHFMIITELENFMAALIYELVIKHNNKEKIRKILDITNDFSEEEENTIIRKNRYSS